MSLITAQNMHKTYQMGEVQIQALQRCVVQHWAWKNLYHLSGRRAAAKPPCSI